MAPLPRYETFALAWRNDAYMRILLILSPSVFMIFAERQLLHAASQWSVWERCALVLAAIAIVCNARTWSAPFTADTLQAVRMFELVLSLVGFFLLCFGPQPSRKLMFP